MAQNFGLQQNNYSPMGLGQPAQGKNSKRQTGFMDEIGAEDPILESVSPGIPERTINSTLPGVSHGYSNNAQVLAPQPVQPQGPVGIPSTYRSDPKFGGQVYSGYTPAQAMEGFNFNREQNTGKSAKDAFAFLSNQAAQKGQLAPLHDKQALGGWFEQHIRPGMQQLGHNVSWVDGDKFGYGNHEGNFVVDYGRGAGAQGGALAWQAELPNQGSGLPTSAPANEIYRQAQQALTPMQQNQEELDQLIALMMMQNQEMI
jgi:hypothetical protein